MALPENPINRYETYLAKIAGQEVEMPDHPITREEAYLDHIAKHGAGGGISFVKIWENQNPTENMNAQDITISSVAEYRKFLLFYRMHKSEDPVKMNSIIFTKEAVCEALFMGTQNNKLRDFSITNDTTFHVGTCRIAQYSLDTSVNAAYLIPCILYAIDEG